MNKEKIQEILDDILEIDEKILILRDKLDSPLQRNQLTVATSYLVKIRNLYQERLMYPEDDYIKNEGAN